MIAATETRPAMELLAPAGTLAAFEAALEEGADAIYVGAPGLNARALARDFTYAEIAAMTRAAHVRGRRLYVAMNSLLKEREIRLALEALETFDRIQPDALIIQDLGILYLARHFFPGLKLHASTLMTACNSLAVSGLGSLGFERVVLARELSLQEMKAIAVRTNVPLEIFIHGAMCFSLSGLCRFSSLHGGKSSLRGQCVQPCRRPYAWLPSGKRPTALSGGKGDGYLFSMNDLCGIEHLQTVRDAGVISLKIEGRLKSVEYVRNTVRAYRLALDGLAVDPIRRDAMLAEARRYLNCAMGRRYTAGFLGTDTCQKLISPHLSGNTGEMVGRVTRLDFRKRGETATVMLQVALQAEVNRGDRLRLHDERSDERRSFTLRRIEFGGQDKVQGQPGQTVFIDATGLKIDKLRQPFRGLLFRVDVSDRTETARSPLIRPDSGQRLAPSDPVRIEAMLASLGLAEKRSETKAASQRPARSRKGRGQSSPPPGRPQWWLKVPGLDIVGHRLPFTPAAYLVDCDTSTMERYRLQRQRARMQPLPLIWNLPAVIFEDRLDWYRHAIGELRQGGTSRFQIGHCSQLGLFVDENGQVWPDVEIFGADSLNLLNSAALLQAAEMGLAGSQFSPETDRATLAAAVAQHHASVLSSNRRRFRLGLLLYGRPPLFTARADSPHFQGRRGLASSRGEIYSLDRAEEVVRIRSRAAFSLLAHVNDLTGLGLDYFVVDISQGQTKRECIEVTALLSGRGQLPAVICGNYGGNLL